MFVRELCKDPLGLRRSVCLLAGRGWGRGGPRFHQNSLGEEDRDRELDFILAKDFKRLHFTEE